MKLWSDSLEDGARIDERLSFGKAHPTQHVELAGNRNPHLAWSDLPKGTRSLVLLCHDPDVPSAGDDVNQEGRTVPSTLPRVDFFHWVLVDLDPALGSIAEASFSEGVSPRGKDGPGGPQGTRQGTNNYTQWFEGDADMGGDYFGYDGPCPPWNDSIIHHYVFTLFALDVDRCPIDGKFDGFAVREAIKGHVLGEAAITGTYTLNPDVG